MRLPRSTVPPATCAGWGSRRGILSQRDPGAHGWQRWEARCPLCNAPASARPPERSPACRRRPAAPGRAGTTRCAAPPTAAPASRSPLACTQPSLWARRTGRTHGERGNWLSARHGDADSAWQRRSAPRQRLRLPYRPSIFALLCPLTHYRVGALDAHNAILGSGGVSAQRHHCRGQAAAGGTAAEAGGIRCTVGLRPVGCSPCVRPREAGGGGALVPSVSVPQLGPPGWQPQQGAQPPPSPRRPLHAPANVSPALAASTSNSSPPSTAASRSARRRSLRACASLVKICGAARRAVRRVGTAQPGWCGMRRRRRRCQGCGHGELRARRGRASGPDGSHLEYLLHAQRAVCGRRDRGVGGWRRAATVAWRHRRHPHTTRAPPSVSAARMACCRRALPSVHASSSPTASALGPDSCVQAPSPPVAIAPSLPSAGGQAETGRVMSDALGGT